MFSTPVAGPTTSSLRRLVLGLGNDILGDDSIGLRVVRQLRDEFHLHPPWEIRETTEAGLVLLDEFVGFHQVILVDAIQTGRQSPGSILELVDDSLPRGSVRSAHALGVGETLALGRALGLSMPEEVIVFAIEIEDPFTITTSLSPALESALPDIVDRIALRIAAASATAGPGVQPLEGLLRGGEEKTSSGLERARATFSMTSA